MKKVSYILSKRGKSHLAETILRDLVNLGSIQRDISLFGQELAAAKYKCRVIFCSKKYGPISRLSMIPKFRNNSNLLPHALIVSCTEVSSARLHVPEWLKLSKYGKYSGGSRA